MQMTQVSYCGEDIITVEDFLKKDLQLSGQSLKKFQLPKNYLHKSLRPKDVMDLPLDLLNKELVNPEYLGPQVEILFEDQDFLVVDKPANIHGHPLCYSDQKNLLSSLRSCGHFAIPSVKEGGQEKGWLYRLDFETSGVLVGCKSASDYMYYRQNFSDCLTLKRYLCLVKGVGPADAEYVVYLKASGRQGAKVRASFHPDGQRAVCTLKKLQQDGDYSVFQVDLETGARHQIRATFELLGFSLVGDVLYGGEKADRLYLHAFEYQLKTKVGAQLKFKSLPLCFGDHFLNLNSLLKMLHD